MKHMLSLPVVAVFLISNWLSLTCGFQCGHESQSPVDHSSSLHAEHAHGPDSKPFAIAGQHTCGTHDQAEVPFSPERIVQMNKLSCVMAVLPEALQGQMPDSGEQWERPWRFDSALSRPLSISLRI